MSGKTGIYNLRHRISGAFQTVDKPLYFLKMGSQGRSPRQGLGAVAPVKSPFPGERGFRQGCRNKDTPSFARGKAIRVS